MQFKSMQILKCSHTDFKLSDEIRGTSSMLYCSASSVISFLHSFLWPFPVKFLEALERVVVFIDIFNKSCQEQFLDVV